MVFIAPLVYHVASYSFHLANTAVVILIAAAGFLLVQTFSEPKVPKDLRLPPSPPGGRFFGGHTHLWDGAPTNQPSTNQLVKWSYELGEVYQLRFGTQRWFVFTSPQAIKEVFDKHGGVTGSKQSTIVANEILSGGNRVIFMPYGKHWRTLRAIIHQCLSSKATDKLKPSQDVESRHYLYDLLTDPDNFLDHVKRYATSVIVYALYGIRITSLQHPLLKAVYKSTAKFAEVAGSRYLVDEYPILTRLPKPLQWWRWDVEPYRKEGDTLMMSLWTGLKKQLKSGKRTGCFVETFMDVGYSEKGVTDLQAAWVAGSMIEAGADTTQLTLNSTILGLVLFPEVVQKAHEELDRVVGNRMPQFEDSPNLPYIRAIVKEVLRWRSPVNDHIRHSTTEDVVYKDYFIPAGSEVVLNLWALHYDPVKYPEPERFNPDRFLGQPALDMTAGECINTSDVNKRDHYAFGAGRRVCPGYNLAENSLFILTARLLWAFDVKAVVDPKTGQRVNYDMWNYYPERLFGPKPFPVSFKVRDVNKAEQIRCGFEQI